MRALVQRVYEAHVEVAGQVVGSTGPGLLVYLGVAPADTPEMADKLAAKVGNLRIFGDEQGKLNLSVRDARGGVLVISNFTLLADASKGRRPAFTGAAAPEPANALYERFVKALADMGVPVACGVFGADMTIRSQAAGPVNIIIDL